MNVIGSWSRHFLGEAVKGILFAYKTIHPKFSSFYWKTFVLTS